MRLERIADPKLREQLAEHLVNVVPDDLNIAQHKPVKISVEPEGAHRPECAVDGNTKRDSAWWGHGTPSWLQVDLGEPVRIGAVRIFFYWDGKRYYQYTIEASLDEKAWETVVDESRNTTPSAPNGFLHVFTPVQARFVRVNVLKNSVNPSAHIVELKVYPDEGKGSGAGPGRDAASTAARTTDTVKPSGQLLVAENGFVQLYFGEGLAQLVTIRCHEQWLGSMCCVVAQFEKKGIGYKGAGVGSARATVVRKVEPVESGGSVCGVDVTAERVRSEETMRKFEATYRFTLCAGQNWFESRLLRIRNADAMPYEVRGYYHLLQPDSASDWTAICCPMVAGWVGGAGMLGAMVRSPDDFVLGLRKTSGTLPGEITRKIEGRRIDPGTTWQGEEPGLIVFCGPKATETDLVKESARIKTLLSATPAAGSDGRSPK